MCNACGGCRWICPTRAVRLIETIGGYLLPEVDENLCNGCGLCLSICPGMGFGETLFAALPEDPFTGKIIKTLVGKTTDPEIYRNAQSGGAVTALLKSALQAGFIGNAVTVAMGDMLRPTAVLSNSVEALRASQKSKYCPVPLLSVLDQIRNSPSPVAVVGLPCQLHGLQNILDINKALRSKIRYKIGLVCERVMTYAALDFLCNRAGAVISNVADLHFKDKLYGGYPGNTHLVLRTGDSLNLNSRVRKRIKNYFTPARCRLCFDKLNIFADVVLCDPHGIAQVDRKGGESAVLIRTHAGQELVDNAMGSNSFFAREIFPRQIFTGQGIEAKRSEWYGYSVAWENLGLPLPNYCTTVRPSAARPRSVKLYAKNLRHSLSLDGFTDRNALLKSVKRRLWFDHIRRLASLPSGVFHRIGQL
jgi:coenzyme F420 hydrogenase subunit beta